MNDRPPSDGCPPVSSHQGQKEMSGGGRYSSGDFGSSGDIVAEDGPHSSTSINREFNVHGHLQYPVQNHPFHPNSRAFQPGSPYNKPSLSHIPNPPVTGSSSGSTQTHDFSAQRVPLNPSHPYPGTTPTLNHLLQTNSVGGSKLSQSPSGGNMNISSETAPGGGGQGKNESSASQAAYPSPLHQGWGINSRSGQQHYLYPHHSSGSPAYRSQVIILAVIVINGFYFPACCNLCGFLMWLYPHIWFIYILDVHAIQ